MHQTSRCTIAKLPLARSDMHIVFIATAYPANSTSADFWDFGICQIHQARALRALGHQVTVLSRSAKNGSTEKDGVTYCFVRDALPSVLRPWQSSAPVLKKLKQINADVVHFHGLTYPIFLMRVRRAVAKSTKVFAEYHGDGVSRFPFNVLQRLSFRRITGLIFTNPAKADHWSVQFRLSRDRLHYAVECAPDRQIDDRQSARQRTGFQGQPVLLWNSRAIARRHPDLVIESYERYLQGNPDAECHFYMMVPDGDAQMLARITAMAERSEALRQHLTLILGRRPQAAMSDYYNSADYIISGSEDDPYGYGVADAMSCGVIPIVPRSTTFLDITRDGAVGLLWDVRDASSLLGALNRMSDDAGEIAQQSREVLATFNENLSMAAQSKALARIYGAALSGDARE